MSSPSLDDLELTTIDLSVADGVATVTLDRPDVYNSFDPTMTGEVASVWQALRHADDVRAVVLTASGDKAFCTGIDRSSVEEFGLDPFSYEDPGKRLGPKSQSLWKPVIAAVNGMACGGAFYFLAEADVILAAEHATFFDPHVTYSMTAVFEPLLMLPRMPFGEVVRMTLTGAHERISARRALEVGFLTDVVPGDQLVGEAQRLAAAIASQPTIAVQATLRTLWAARDLTPKQSLDLGNVFLQLGTSTEALQQGQEVFASGKRVQPKIR